MRGQADLHEIVITNHIPAARLKDENHGKRAERVSKFIFPVLFSKLLGPRT